MWIKFDSYTKELVPGQLGKQVAMDEAKQFNSKEPRYVYEKIKIVSDIYNWEKKRAKSTHTIEAIIT